MLPLTLNLCGVEGWTWTYPFYLLFFLTWWEDVYSFTEPNLVSKINMNEPVRSLRNNEFVAVGYHGSVYGLYEPISSIIKMFNGFSHSYDGLSTRNVCRARVRSSLLIPTCSWINSDSLRSPIRKLIWIRRVFWAGASLVCRWSYIQYQFVVTPVDARINKITFLWYK